MCNYYKGILFDKRGSITFKLISLMNYSRILTTGQSLIAIKLPLTATAANECTFQKKIKSVRKLFAIMHKKCNKNSLFLLNKFV